MTIDPNNSRHLIADEGKVLARITDGNIYGTELTLGKILFDKDGNRLPEPIDDTAENFHDVDMPETENENAPEDGE